MHFGSPGGGGSTSGHVRAALEFTFLNSAVDANGERPALPGASGSTLMLVHNVPGDRASTQHSRSSIHSHATTQCSRMDCTCNVDTYCRLG